MEFTPFVVAQLPAACRIASALLCSPILANRHVPWLVRLPVAVGLTAVLLPLTDSASVESLSPLSLVAVLIHESLLGGLLGLSLWLVVWAIRLTAELIENLCGFSLAGAWDAPPSHGAAAGPLIQLYWWVMLALFIGLGGLSQLILGLMNSFDAVPAGTALQQLLLADYLAAALSSSFALALRTAIPALFALLGAAMVLGLAQRNFPQFGGLQIGLGLKTMTGILVTSLLLLIMPWMLASGLDDAMARYELLMRTIADF